MTEFSDEELEIIKTISKRRQADVNLSRVKKILRSPDFNGREFRLFIFSNIDKRRSVPIEAWVATEIDEHRNNRYEDQGPESLAQPEVASTTMSASYGLQILRNLGGFWRFEPTVEAIFELDDEQLVAAENYFISFDDSDHRDILMPRGSKLIDEYQKWTTMDSSTERISLGKEIYTTSMKICERGFPNLLALKRILDGETPEVERLQQIRASKIRRELTNEEEEPNSVYFDLIVSRFDSTIRNGIAHGDIVIEPSESQVRIPLKDVEYSYEDFMLVVKENMANAMFLTGTLGPLVHWHATTTGAESRKPRPDWVFGERSVPTELVQWLEDNST